MSSQGGHSKSNTPTSTDSANSQSTTALSPPDRVSTGISPVSRQGEGSASVTSVSIAALDIAMESVEQDVSDVLNKNLDGNRGKPKSSKDIAAVQGQQGELGHDGQDSATTPLKGDG